jgi:hypothetical protein
VAGAAEGAGSLTFCLLAGATVTRIAASAFSLAWAHSVEKTGWQEDWLVEDGGLRIVAARIESAGAGMEPPEGAVLGDGRWHYHPKVGPVPELSLAASPHAQPWQLCAGGLCMKLGGESGSPIVIRPCP